MFYCKNKIKKVVYPISSVGQSATLIRWRSPVQAWHWVPIALARVGLRGRI